MVFALLNIHFVTLPEEANCQQGRGQVPMNGRVWVAECQLFSEGGGENSARQTRLYPTNNLIKCDLTRGQLRPTVYAAIDHQQLLSTVPVDGVSVGLVADEEGAASNPGSRKKRHITPFPPEAKYNV